MTQQPQEDESGGFAARFGIVVRMQGGASVIARLIGRSEGAVRKWLRGESEPHVTDLRLLCDHTRTRIEWLVSGRGEREVGPPALREMPAVYSSGDGTVLDYALLERVMEHVDQELKNVELTLPPTKRSMLVVTLYQLFHERKAIDPEAVARLVKLARS